MSVIQRHIDSILPELVALRRDLHSHPELGFEETRTATRVVEVLRETGRLSIRTGVAKTGVVAVLNGDKSAPCLALRADMDALPIVEQTGLGYASRSPGRMHACGHDGHTTCLLGAARVLARMADELPGPVKFIFQPAEENGGGGRQMVEAGVLEDPPVEAAIALHAWPTQPVGTIAVRSGPAMASTDTCRIRVEGRGAHGAYPHRGIDPILAASHIVVALQSIVARNVDPIDHAVVTVGSIHGGTVCNIIPTECTLEATLRAHNARTREGLRESVRRIAENTARALGATAHVEMEEGYPVTVNDPALSRWVVDVGREVLGPDRVVTDEPPSMGGEDFAYYGQKVPAVMFRLGVRPPGADSYPGLHNPMFDFNDDALAVGVRMFCELAVRFSRRPPATAG